MTTRKRPSLRDNMTEGGDETARQLEQAAELEQLRQAAAEAAPGQAAAAKSAFEESPSPVAALAHAYMHGSGGTPPAQSSGRGLTAVAAVLALAAVGLAGAAGVLSYKEYKEGRVTVAAAPAPAATPAPPVSGAAPAAKPAPAAGGASTPAAAPTAAPPPAQSTESRVGALESTLGSVFTGGLTDRVTALEKQVAQISGGSQVVGILAARQLRGALADSAPFQSELALARLSGVATGDLGKALDRVAPRAAEGIPTRGELNARFAALVPAALNAELGSAGSGGIGETMWGWVTGVASVLRLPASQTVVEDETSSAALLARAGIMLEAGDLPGAIDRVSGLKGPAAQVATAWLNDARARTAADQAATLLANRVTELLANGKR